MRSFGATRRNSIVCSTRVFWTVVVRNIHVRIILHSSSSSSSSRFIFRVQTDRQTAAALSDLGNSEVDAAAEYTTGGGLSAAVSVAAAALSLLYVVVVVVVVVVVLTLTLCRRSPWSHKGAGALPRSEKPLKKSKFGCLKYIPGTKYNTWYIPGIYIDC